MRNARMEEYEKSRLLPGTSPLMKSTLRSQYVEDMKIIDAEITTTSGTRGQQGAPRDRQAEAGPWWDLFYARFQYAPLRPRVLSNAAMFGLLGEMASAHRDLIEATSRPAPTGEPAAGNAPPVSDFMWSWFETTYVTTHSINMAAHSACPLPHYSGCA